MDTPHDSSLPPNAAVQHSNAPLAPSQEAAYRKKCIQLKRRLAEVESNNDVTRRRIEQEKQHVQKMRLMRAILLDHLKQIAETPGKKLSDEQLQELGVRVDGTTRLSEIVGANGDIRPDGEALLDDSSEDEEEDPEPAERPERRRRANNTYREAIMTTTPGPNPSTYIYQQPGPLGLASTTSLPSPTARRESAAVTALTSSRNNNTTQAAPAPTLGLAAQQPYPSDVRQSSPAPAAASASQSGSFSHPNTTKAEPSSFGSPAASSAPARQNLPPQPVRPSAPFKQFTDHMRPQLEADSYPDDQIESRIEQEWRDLSIENKELWQRRYAEQMMEYTVAMDDWKRSQKRVNNSVTGLSFSETRNRT